jgi:hypothetical protein
MFYFFLGVKIKQSLSIKMMKMSKMNICCLVLAILAILFFVLYMRQRKRCPAGSVVIYKDDKGIHRRGYKRDDWTNTSVFGPYNYPTGMDVESFRYMEIAPGLYLKTPAGGSQEHFRYGFVDTAKKIYENLKTIIKNKITQYGPRIFNFFIKIGGVIQVQGMSLNKFLTCNVILGKGTEALQYLVNTLMPKFINWVKNVPAIGSIIKSLDTLGSYIGFNLSELLSSVLPMYMEDTFNKYIDKIKEAMEKRGVTCPVNIPSPDQVPIETQIPDDEIPI